MALKKGSSVSTIAWMRPDRITRAIASGSKCSRITPLLGDAFFTSAMTPGRPGRVARQRLRKATRCIGSLRPGGHLL